MPPELELELDELLDDELLLEELLVLPEDELLEDELLEEEELLEELEDDEELVDGFSPEQAVKNEIRATEDNKPCQLMGLRPRITLLIKSALMLQVSMF